MKILYHQKSYLQVSLSFHIPTEKNTFHNKNLHTKFRVLAKLTFMEKTLIVPAKNTRPSTKPRDHRPPNFQGH